MHFPRDYQSIRWQGSAPALLLPLLMVFAIVRVYAPATASAQVIEIREDRLLRVDGKKFFPIGLVELGIQEYPDEWNDMIRRSGANIVWDTGIAFADSSPTCEAIRDSVEAVGYNLIIGSPDTWGWDDPNTPEFEVAQPMYPSDSLAALLYCFAPSSSLIGFANRDEPVWTISRNQIGDVDSLHVLDTHQQLATVSPTRIVAMNFAPAHLSQDLQTWMSDIQGYLGATDVVMFASYPYPPGPGTCGAVNVLGYPDCPMDRLPDSADLFLQDLNGPLQPLWMIIQAHKGIPLEQARWEAYSAIIHGATGVFWAGWNWYHALGNGIDNWPVTEQVVGEIASLHDILVKKDYKDVNSETPDVEVLAKKGPNKSRYVFAVSRREYSGEGVIHLPKASSGALWAEVPFENRWVPIIQKRIVDDFNDYEGHVYIFYEDGSGPSPPTAAGEPEVGAPARSFEIRVFPNPARSVVHAAFVLPRAATTRFGVYDTGGRLIASPEASAGAVDSGAVTWNGRDASGHVVPPGVYFLRGVASTGEVTTARIVLRR